ncbi:DUF3857 domain-containing protein [Prolixibacteraceae bacterium JC049]|nr:DUF3857 domain-containing protein [Prolixibacteraceae bacterium JC049]
MIAKGLSLSYVLILISLISFGKKQPQYPVSQISDELKTDAKAVVRLNKHVFHLKSASSAQEEIEYVITVLNENGLSSANFTEFYNSMIGIGDISATVYDAEGNKMHRIKSDDIVDVKVTGTGTGSIYDDNRIKTFNPRTKQYPFTVAYSFKRNYKGIFHFPTFHLYQGFNVAVEKAIYQIKAENLDDIRFNLMNIDQEAESGTEDKLQTKTWTFSNFHAMRPESMAQNVLLYTPTIELAPRHINIKGYKGNAETWKGFGAFIYKLIKGRDDLSEKAVADIRGMIASAKDDFDKVRIVYEYMQRKTRFISVQVGMGGWQPFDAKTVDRLGYGDCKALSNYMKALLKAIGIPSIYTLVKSGRYARLMNKSFSRNNFTHVILCVPMAKDTIWLECTNQHLPCGFIGDFTDDRGVLLIKEDGGEVAHTTVYSKENNLCQKNTGVHLDVDGNATFVLETQYSGMQYEEAFPLIYMDKKDQKRYIENSISIPNFTLTNFSFENQKERFPRIVQKASVNANNYANKMGDRLIIPLNRISRVRVPAFERNRKSKLDLRRGFTYADSTVFYIPKGMKLNKLPETKRVDSTFGIYETKCEQPSDDILVFKRNLSINKGLYPPSEYINYRKFIQKVNRLDNQKCLLNKE